MIPGVKLIPLVTHTDERGYFREILKAGQLPKFGQWSMSYMYSDIIKAWHCHLHQSDYWFCVSGVIKAVVCDLRESINMHFFNGAKAAVEGYNFRPYLSKIESCEYILGDNQPPQVLVIPPGVAHGLKVLQGPAILMYITSEEYNPDDEGRIPYDALGYDWDKRVIK